MIGNELRKAREEAGLTQEALAFEAKLDRSYVSLLERGKRTPTIDTIFDICTALGVRPSAFVARLERAQGWKPKRQRPVRSG